METSSLSDGTTTGTFIIIESMEDNEARDKSIELYERCKQLKNAAKVLENENESLRNQLRNRDILMDQNILVNEKRVSALKKKAQSAELLIMEASSKLKYHQNQRTSVPTMKIVADTLRSIANDLVKEDHDVELVFGDDIIYPNDKSFKPNTASLSSSSQSSGSKRRKTEINEIKQSHLTLAPVPSDSRELIRQIPRSGLGNGNARRKNFKNN